MAEKRSFPANRYRHLGIVFSTSSQLITEEYVVFDQDI